MSMADFRIGPILFNVVIYGLIVANTEALFVKTTILTSAVAKGAVCLDGSPPAYNFDKGTGTGINNWLVHFEGGGWCHNVTNCKSRSTSRLGSSKVMGPELAFSGILNNRKEQNPDFYNWNRVKLRYCDGASFTGDVEKVDPATNLHFRGARIWSAVVEELLSLGMKTAQNVLLSGCSAGGLAATLHCDGFKKLLPPSAKLKCLNDGGYFVNVKDISKGSYVENYLAEIVTLHGSSKNLPASCTSKMKPTLCFFPQNVAPQIQQPFFVLHSAIDSWQIKNILAPAVVDTGGAWSKCKLDYTACTPDQLQTMQDFRKQFLEVLPPPANPTTRGLFIDSCYAHCQSEMQGLWSMPQSPGLNGTKIATAVGDWYFERSPVSKIDCPYPCNPTCPVRAPQQQGED